MRDTREHGSRLRQLAGLFLKLGTISFGGPAAHIAMMEAEVVGRRGWLSRAEFLDLVGATNLIPGPNSTELALHIGHRRAGWPGLLVAGLCFMLPAVVIVTAIAWAYVRFGKLPQFAGVMGGIKPVLIAIVVQALWRLGRTAVKNAWIAALGLAGLAACLAGVHELAVLFASGFIACSARGLTRPGAVASFAPFAAAFPVASVTAAASTPFGAGALFLFFLKVGSVLFGSGYVLFAFLRADLVERWHWLTEAQLLDAIAVGQFTPGPLFTTATFIGYVLGGFTGAGIATVGIFLPAFFFVAVSAPLIPRLRASQGAGAFLDGLNVASLALMALVTLHFGFAALIDVKSLVLAGAAAFALFHLRLNSTWLVLGGALLGALFW